MKLKVKEILVIGLRLRFFLISFVLLSVFAATTFIFDRFWLYQQMYNQIDSQLETMASSLVASGLSLELLNNFESTDDLVRDALEDQRVDRTIRLFTPDGRLQFSNEMGSAVDFPLSANRWDIIQVRGRDLRILTLKTDQFILEVGIFLQPLLTKVNHQVRNYTYVLIVIFILATIFSFWISGLIVRPVNELAKTFSILKSEGIDSGDFSKINSDPRMKSLLHLSNNKDDVGKLANDLVSMFHHLNLLHDNHRKDLFFLAHELKTPLAKIVFQVEDLLSQGSIEDDTKQGLKDIREKCREVARFIDDYIRIAALRASRKENLTILAQNIGLVCSDIVNGIFSNEKTRIVLNIKNDFTVFAESAHLQSLISNLIQNALTYSESKIDILVDDQVLKIQDFGDGLPEQVLSHLGEAFNKTSHPKSSGLGLAFVKSVCDLYGWKMFYEHVDGKTTFAIHFFS